MRFRAPVCGIVRREPKIYFIGARGNCVVDHDTVGKGIVQFKNLLIGTQRNQLAPVLDDCVLHPVGIRRIGATVCFEIVDADLAAGNLRAADDQPIAFTGERECVNRGEGLETCSRRSEDSW